MIDLERRVVETEAVVEDQLELAPHRMTVGTRWTTTWAEREGKPDVIVQT